MNLEAIEQRCVAYLKETPHAVVPVPALMEHLRQDEDCADVNEVELLGFLRRHELFTVIEPMTFGEDLVDPVEIETARLMNAPKVILKTRLPSKTELSDALHEQMGTMMNALEAAMNQARGKNNPKRAMEVQAILKRARDLQQKMDDAGL